MRNRRLFLFLICFLSAISIKADNTVSVGSDIKLYAPASDDIRKPDLYDIKWRIASGDFNAVTLIGDTQNPVIVRGTAPGTVIISCTARFYNKALWTDPMYSGWITRSASYTVTCTDPNSGGGGGDNPGGGGGDTPGGGGDPSGYKDGDIFSRDNNGVDTQYKIINVSQRTAQIGLGYANSGTAIWKDIKLDVYFIKEMANGFFITEIADCAFCECKNVKKIFLGESNDRLKRIGSNAFQNCDALTFLTVPNSVTTIDDGAFSLCDNLEEVTIGSSVQSIGASVFWGDRNLNKVTILSTTPPNIQSNTFDEKHYSTVIVIVPKGSKSKYMNESYWKKFKNLTEEGESPDAPEDIFINETNFPDENFRKNLLDNGYKTGEDIVKVKRLNLRSKGIKSLKGIEYFTSLTSLDCRENQLTSIDLSKNTELRELLFYGNNIRDEGMDALINSLPIVPTNDGVFEVVSVTYMGQYVCKCTKSQVAAAKAKGWIPCWDLGGEYEGSKDPEHDPTSISVSPSSKTIKVGDTFTATYTLSPSNATTTVTWTSENSSIASVDYYGKVKGIKEGTAYIYATTSNNISDYCKVTVTNPIEEIKVTKITLNYSSPLSLTVGDTREFSAYVSPYDATDKTVSWLSSNSTVASVDKDGLVEAKSKGTATITCKANDGSGIQATCEITVESVKNWSYFKAKTAEGVEMQFYVEKVSDGVCKVSGSPAIDINTTGSITIPNEVEGLKVTGVGYAAFKDCAGITSVIVPSTVTKIESYAFTGCTNLNNVSLGNNVEDLGYSVFWGCSSLDKITGINKLESIGSSAFRLEEYNTYIPWYNNLPDGLLYLGKVLYKYKGRMPDGTTVNVSEGTTQIGQDCFEDCEGLVAITIPRSVKSIGDYIFDGCTNLTSISVDSSNDKYDSRSNCDAIIDTNNNTVIAGCKNTTFPSTIKAIGFGAFYGSGLTEAVIPNNIDSIANHAFAYSRSLTSVIIGKGTRVIGKDDNPFIGCLKLNNITVANGNPHYDSRDNCNAIIEKASGTLIVGCPATVIPLSVKAIGRNSFYNYNDMFTLTIPDNVEKINQYAVEYVYSLRALTLGKGIKDIGTRAFYGCRNLRVIHSLAKDPIELDESVFSCDSENADSVYKSATLYVPVGSRINYMTTSGWNKFKKIEEISDDTRLSFSINSADGGKLTFMVTDVKAKTCELIAINKDAMGEITVPSQADGYIVVGIGYDTFYNIPNITKVNLPNTINYFGSHAFYNCEDLESLELPSSLESIGYFALGSTKLKEIVIPSSVSRIDKGIFTANRELTSVIVDKRNPWYDSRGNCNAVIERTSNTLVAGCKATVIPHDVERIGDYAFNSLPLKNIDLPNSLTSIGESAFNNNKELEKIILPSSLTHIGTEAFRLCVNLSKVYSYIQIPFNINESVFRSTYPTDVDRFATTTLYVPNGTKSLYKSTDGWKLFQNIVEFDSSNINNLRMDSNRDSSIYDLFGRKINKPRKGINIIGGKKVLIK